MLSLREDDLKSISFSTSCGAWVTFTREEIVKALTCYQRTQSIKERANEVNEHLKNMKHEREISKITEMEHRLDEHTAFNTAHHLDFLALKERVKKIEQEQNDQKDAYPYVRVNIPGQSKPIIVRTDSWEVK